MNSKDYRGFLKGIGASLPIRRAFRNWLSEKLFNNGNEVKAFIESAIIDDTIESYWKDEIYVSILLSDYAEVFFGLFKNKLLENNQALLVKIVFLLRIGCKEIDEDLLNIFGIQKTSWSALKTIFTKPKGRGWESTINFIHEHKDDLGLQRMNIILPMLDDWNNKNKMSATTKQASQIALYYYNEITKERYYHISDRKEGQLIRVILQGSSETTNELKAIFDEVISNKEINYRDRYYALIKPILTSLTDSFEVVKALPNYVIKLADIFWFYNPDDLDDDYRYSRRMDMEDYFCISSIHNDFFPASAFQTPIYQLLRIAPQETADFILSFTNKTVECYVRSELDGEIEQVDVFVDNKVIKQYISNRLWCMYRGTQVAPYLLESMHMALEKWLLEVARSASKEVIESWCHYLIKNSKSVSITAVVSSVVLAQPSKLFNIAKILFQTKEFFLYDTSRLLLDGQAKMQYSIGYGLNFDNQIHQDERIKTCDDSHRKHALEHLAFNYQMFRAKEESEDEVKDRQEIIWGIIDKYYAELPDKSSETKSDKTWKLYLARMDRRKMSPEVEETDEGTLIKFNPEIDPDLKKHSEDTQREISEKMKYTSLRVWADSRFRGEKETYEK
ncbi:MAG: ATP-binding protein, partial [Spirochaetes bacterium]|nr:ATP-binding protein [Spirochaetota bacterium]